MNSNFLPFDPVNDIVLVIDDSRAFRALFRRNLSNIGITSVLEAEDGLHALSLATNPAIRYRLRLVLCDLVMPNMDGFSFVKRFKELPAEGPVPSGAMIPVVVVSTEHSEADVREALSTGVQGFIVKPVDEEVLRRRIFGLVDQGICKFSGRSMPVQSPAPEVSDIPAAQADALPSEVKKRPHVDMKVLVIDDSPAVTRLLAMYLKKIGFKLIFEVNNSERAMDMMADVDLIITDIMMPVKSGVDLVRHLRSLPGKAASLPVMAVSSLGDIEKIAELMSYGIDEYLSKPFSETDFIAKVINLAQKGGLFEVELPRRR